MQQTRPQFTHEELLSTIRKSFNQGLKRHGPAIKTGKVVRYTNLECLMAGLAVFTFKFPSLLKLDQFCNEEILRPNLLRLFELEDVPCDTQTPPFNPKESLYCLPNITVSGSIKLAVDSPWENRLKNV